MKHPFKFFLAACAAILFSVEAMAAETQLVTATGYGMSVDEAKRAAVRSAVEAVVGTLVDAETIVENDQLVQDKILSYSAGMVEDVKIIGVPKKNSAGLVMVRVQVKVRKTELAERVKSTIKTSVKINGESLYQQAIFSRENRNNAQQLIEKLFSPERLQCLIKAEPASGESGSPIEVDHATGEVFIHVKCWLDLESYRQWSDEILEKLGLLAQEQDEWVAKHLREVRAQNCKGKTPTMSILVSLRSLKVVTLTFAEAYEEMLKKVFGGYTDFDTYPYIGNIQVSLLDKSGDEIKIASSHCLLLAWHYLNCSYSVFPGIISREGILDEFYSKVSMGVLNTQDLRDIDSVSVEVEVKKRNGN